MNNKILIYHNPRCKKSREALNYLNHLNIDHSVILYISNPLNEKSLKDLLSKLKIKAIDLVRKNELLWKSEFSKRNLNEDDIISIMIDNPKIIERPIIEYKETAVIGRPIENLYDFLKTLNHKTF